MLPIELISHIARPVSLSMRLLGNIVARPQAWCWRSSRIFADRRSRCPFMVMGVFVSVVQAVVFSLLTTVYIAQAVAHEEH